MGRGGTRQEREQEKGGALRRRPFLIAISGYFRNQNSNFTLHVTMLNFMDLIYSKIFYTPIHTPKTFEMVIHGVARLERRGGKGKI